MSITNLNIYFLEVKISGYFNSGRTEMFIFSKLLRTVIHNNYDIILRNFSRLKLQVFSIILTFY